MRPAAATTEVTKRDRPVASIGPNYMVKVQEKLRSQFHSNRTHGQGPYTREQNSSSSAIYELCPA
jgi:hypothetical protein